MSHMSIKLVLSDLHLGDGAFPLECFGERHQAAFEGLIAATLPAVGSQETPLGQSDDLELIINGDCFDFLVVTPYSVDGVVEVATAMQKLEKILIAHQDFFDILRIFIEAKGRTITFIAGNHDLELCFAEVRERICSAIIGNTTDERVHFCPTRFYRPLADIYIEHGNHYDFWNHRTMNLWDEQGQPLTLAPRSITLSPGSRYFQRATYAVSLRYPYFDHFEPSINATRQIAMLSLLDPRLVVHTAHATMQLLSYPRRALAKLSLKDRRNPVRLFEEAIQDFAAFQMDMYEHEKDWVAIPHKEGQVSQSTIMEVLAVRESLTLPTQEAFAALCTSSTYQMGEDVASGMHTVLKQDASLRYAIAGHTHMMRIEPGESRNQVYLNTASWTERLALPTPQEVTPALIAWLSNPDWQHIPLRDLTRPTFALIMATDGGPSSASLCLWEGGRHGCYRVLA
jgi:UDP-2,3-diacylglucosamine pyrophosphatase LpxH